MKYQVTVSGRTLMVTVDGDRISVEGTTCFAELRRLPGTPLRLLVIEQSVWVLPIDTLGPHQWLLQDAGERHEVEVLDERTAHIRSLVGTRGVAAGPKPLKAPMPGLVVRVAATPGQEVAAGTSLVVLEAMKMENDLKAAAAGVVDRVTIAPGQTVEKGAVLVTFRP